MSISDASFSISMCNFSFNIATSLGGAIGALAASVDLKQVQIVENAASLAGGLSLISNSTVSVHDSIISENTASSGAGGICILILFCIYLFFGFGYHFICFVFSFLSVVVKLFNISRCRRINNYAC